ncbi:hypothetical protein FRC04_005510 [Tulasnella sp. 424]|nr:hypothetical protein FRC04_005510 [Tulasnella sp. 424]KAG8974996.1 hypothetical protein FRC05_006673 [Tulasnella sp. 425]
MDQAATSSIIDTHDEKVLIAVSALGDMRGTGLAVDNDMVPGPSSSSAYWDRGTHSRVTTSIAPTPSLSAASTSSQATSPSTVTRTLDDDEYDDGREFDSRTAAEAADSVLTRVSNIPLVNTALRAYDYSKASSRVINYGAGLVESSVKAVSKPVINRLPVDQLDEFACRQLDRLGRYGGGPRNESNEGEASTSAQVRDRSASRVRSRSSSKDGVETPQTASLMDTASEDEASQGQVEVANRSGWQTVLMEASGIGAAISEENMKRLKYCLEWLQYATARIDQQITLLQKFLASLDAKMSENPGALVPLTHMRTLTDVKRDVVTTVRQVVEVMSKYAGGALPEPARATLRSFILLLPERWANAMQQQEAEMNAMGGPASTPGETEMAASTAERAAKRVLTLATESLDMMKGAAGVFKESLDRAEAWVERLRVVGIQRQRQRGQLASAPDSPAVNIQGLSISSSSAYDDTPVGRRRPSHPHSDLEEDEDDETETEADSNHASSGRGLLRRRQRRRIASPSPDATARLTGRAPPDVAM